LLLPYKLARGKRYDQEVKLSDLSEEQIFSILGKLSEIDCTVYCVATEMSLVTDEESRRHQAVQVEKITHHIDKMRFPKGRAGLQKLAEDVRGLSSQLYIQLICQVELVKEVIDRGILYHVQRTPKCLDVFRWRIDQKNTTKSLFERTFENIAPSLLQTIALDKPTLMCTDFDYSAMVEFIYTEENAPTFLRDAYGLKVKTSWGINGKKLLRSDIAFPSSESEIGLQVVDLIVSSLGRLLRGGFTDEARATQLLGNLMVQNVLGDFPVRLVSVGGASSVVSDRIAGIVRAFARFSKPMHCARAVKTNSVRR